MNDKSQGQTERFAILVFTVKINWPSDKNHSSSDISVLIFSSKKSSIQLKVQITIFHVPFSTFSHSLIDIYVQGRASCLNIFRRQITIGEEIRRSKPQLKSMLQQCKRIINFVVATIQVALQKNFVCNNSRNSCYDSRSISPAYSLYSPMSVGYFASAIIALNFSSTLVLSSLFSSHSAIVYYLQPQCTCRLKIKLSNQVKMRPKQNLVRARCVPCEN